MTTSAAHVGTSAPLPSEERADLAMAAQAAARRNRPTHLVVLALAAAVASGLLAAFAWARLRAADADYSSRRGQLATIAALGAELDAINQAAETDPNRGLTDPIPTLFTDLERLAATAGLDKPSVPQRVFGQAASGLRRIGYPYTVQSPSLEGPMKWVRSAVDSIPGMQVQRLVAKPSGDRWIVEVVFSRVERAE
jgi:hypothetical protein